jgi:4-hydroxy-tetrahydrodipicolinate reductase
VRYESEIDTITITHEAHSRKGLALGAIMAAEFLKGKKGVFTMRDCVNALIR